MDLVKARKRAKQAEAENRKPEEQKAPAREESAPAAPAPFAPPPAKVKQSAPPAPEPAGPTEAPAVPAASPPVKSPPAAKKKAETVTKKTETKPAEPSRPAPDDIFMDSAFGEDLPPLDLGDDEDESMILEPSSSPARTPAAPAEGDEEWEREFNRLKQAAESEERQTAARTAKPPASPPAPKSPPPAPPAKPVAAGKEKEKKMTITPLKIEEDWLVNDMRDSFAPAKVDLEWETGAPLFSGAKADDDFFSLVTEELYQHEFNREAEGDLGRQLELLSFRLGQEIYAVRLTSIRQIIKLVSITTVPRAPEYVLGILSLRGTIIPVFDLRRRLRLGPTEPTRKSRIVVVAVGKFMVGLIVDEVMQVVRLPETKLEPPPSMLNAVEAEYIEGIGRTGTKMIILLALEKIMTPVKGSKG